MTNPEGTKASKIKFECITPILRVENFSATLDFYLNTLGFELNFGAEGGFAGISRDNCGLYLAEGEQGNQGTCVWIGVEDVRTLYDEYRRQGVKILLPPTNFEWALEMQVEDPEGHVLRFGSEPETE